MSETQERRDKPLRPKFGDVLINICAGPTNPTRIGYYVETVTNHGILCLRLTDKRDRVWLHDAWSPRLLTPEEAHDRIFAHEYDQPREGA